MGRVPPKFPTMERGRLFDFVYNTSVTLMCPAQAYPIPAIR